MKRLIHKDTKKNREIISKLLSTQFVNLTKNSPKTLSGADALLKGNACLLQGLNNEALSISEILVDYFPHIIDCHLLKLNALIRLEHLASAMELAKELHKLAPRNLGVLQAYAQLYMLTNQSKEAINSLKKALTLAPGNIELLQIAGECYQQQGNIRKAATIYKQAIKVGLKNKNMPIVEQAMFHLATIEPLSDQNIKSAKNILSENPDDDSLFTLLFALARSARKTKDINTETYWLKKANYKMQEFERARGKIWNRIAIEKRSEAIKNLFDKPVPAWLEKFESDRTEMPIFILAMPRSGTTLLEQIIGGHPEVGQTGESRAFNNAVQLALESLSPIGVFPGDLDRLNVTQLNQITSNTIQHEELLTPKKMIVNKNLSNHLYVGLAANLFPKAKFIYLKRNSLDNCLSVYQQQIVNASYSTELKNIVHAQNVLDDLARYWQELYPEKVYTLEYESMVADGKKTLKKLIDFLGLEWNDGLLEFSKRNNLVRTPSANQVREKLNTQAIDKWKQYEKLLAEVIPPPD